MNEALKAKLMETHAGRKLVVIKVRNPDPEVDEKIEVVVIPPTRIVWKRFIDELKNDALMRKAPDNLLVSCIVYPGKDDFKLLEEQYPGIVSTLTNKLSDLAAVEMDAEVEFLK